jgi:hypothetical protein
LKVRQQARKNAKQKVAVQSINDSSLHADNHHINHLCKLPRTAMQHKKECHRPEQIACTLYTPRPGGNTKKRRQKARQHWPTPCLPIIKEMYSMQTQHTEHIVPQCCIDRASFCWSILAACVLTNTHAVGSKLQHKSSTIDAKIKHGRCKNTHTQSTYAHCMQSHGQFSCAGAYSCNVRGRTPASTQTTAPDECLESYSLKGRGTSSPN